VGGCSRGRSDCVLEWRGLFVVSPSRSVRAEFAGGFKAARRFLSSMAQIQVDEKTLERLDGLRVEDEEYDEIINELINIYRASEMTLFHAGDEY
jgi:hypothetical protein